MRTLRLARIAAEAEGLRLRHRAKRTASRIMAGIIAMVFLFGTLVFAHIAAWYWLRQAWQQQYVALTLGGADLLIALLLVAVAARSSPDQTELEALAVRQRALEAVTASITFSTLAMQLLRIAGRMMARRR